MNAAKELLKRFGLLSEKAQPEVNSIVDARYLKEYLLTGKVIDKMKSTSKPNVNYFMLELSKPVKVLGRWRWYITVCNTEVCKVY
jgi:hypothetical protein